MERPPRFDPHHFELINQFNWYSRRLFRSCQRDGTWFFRQKIFLYAPTFRSRYSPPGISKRWMESSLRRNAREVAVSYNALNQRTKKTAGNIPYSKWAQSCTRVQCPVCYKRPCVRIAKREDYWCMIAPNKENSGAFGGRLNWRMTSGFLNNVNSGDCSNFAIVPICFVGPLTALGKKLLACQRRTANFLTISLHSLSRVLSSPNPVFRKAIKNWWSFRLYSNLYQITQNGHWNLNYDNLSLITSYASVREPNAE